MRKIDFTIIIDEIDSTQDLALYLIKSGFARDKKDILIVSRVQFKGRGQRDNLWSSERGGLYFSYIIKSSEKKLSIISSLSLRVAEVVKKVLEEKYNAFAIIKEPNDVYVKADEGYKKISGILIETTPFENVRYIIIGVGVNFHNRIPYDLKEKATSLFEITGKKYDPLSFLKFFFNILKIDDYEV